MKAIHQGLPVKEFDRPDTGLVEVKVCTESGLIPTQYCPESKEEIFIAGTEPKQFCDIHKFEEERNEDLVRKLQDSMMIEDFDVNYDAAPEMDNDLLQDLEDQIGRERDNVFGSDDQSGSSSGNNVNPLLD